MQPIIAYLGAASALKHVIYYMWSDRRPGGLELVGHVTKLSVHPVKAARGICVDSVECSQEKGVSHGVMEDRQWMVIDEEGIMVNISKEPKMHLIHPRFEGKILVLTSPGQEDVRVDPKRVEQNGKTIQTIVIRVSTLGLDCGDEASSWLCRVLGKDGYRLVYSGPRIARRNYVGDMEQYARWTCVASGNDKLAFQNNSPFMLCSEETVADLNSQLEVPLNILQFRANIVVSALGGKYDEDTWKDVFIGNVRFRTIMLAARCAVLCVDMNTCTRYKKNEPLRTLLSYRVLVPGYNPMLGIDMAVQRPGVIRVGDPIYANRGSNID